MVVDSGYDAGLGPDADARPDEDAGRPDAAWPDAMAPLPPVQSAQTPRFATHDTCASCHQASTLSDALRDAAGADVSMVSLWRTSMMSFAARDPVYLAAFAHELAENPNATELVERTCTRCHAPAAYVELEASGSHPTFVDVVTGTSAVVLAGREGVTCTVCHQIADEGLGESTSFTGGYEIGTERRIFGPHEAPFAMPMIRSTGFEPVASAHVRDSGLCATCHTVLTRALDDAGVPVGPLFPEQVPFLEWRNSDYARAGPRAASCQSCHVPLIMDGADALATPISTRPPFLEDRAPIGRHTFRGANAYVLELIADHVAWVGTDVPVESLRAASRESVASLRSAAELTLQGYEMTDTHLEATVRVENLTGHRFPTGYPTRRAWLRVSGVDSSGAIVWTSGAVDGSGAIVDGSGRSIDGSQRSWPHRRVVESQDQVQMWHTEMLDLQGRRTHVLLRAATYGVDNRILPHGWSSAHADAELTSPVGAEADADFIPGSDDVLIRVPRASGATRLRVELVFQSVPPLFVEGLADHPTPALSTLAGMIAARPAAPIVMSTIVAP